MDMMAMVQNLTYGLYVTGAWDEENGRYSGHVIDAVAQLSMDEEPTVVASVMNTCYTKSLIEKEGVFVLSILPADVDPFVLANFGFQCGRDVSKWENVPYTLRGGFPVLDEAVAWVQFRVADKRVMGTHTAFFCHPTDAEALNPGKDPLRYADYFTKLKNPAMEAFQAFKQGTK